MKTIYVFTDGSYMPPYCPRNRSTSGFGAYAFVYNDNGKTRVGSGLLNHAINSGHCEYTAVQQALLSIKRRYGNEPLDVVIYSDDQVLMDRLSGKLQMHLDAVCMSTNPKKIKRHNNSMFITKLVHQLKLECDNTNFQIMFKHVKAHVNCSERRVWNHGNEFCDKLAKTISKKERARRASTKELKTQHREQYNQWLKNEIAGVSLAS